MNMTGKMFAMLFVGMVIGAGAIGVWVKIYVDNLHHVACRMYQSVENRSTFAYVNTQFKCEK